MIINTFNLKQTYRKYFLIESKLYLIDDFKDSISIAAIFLHVLHPNMKEEAQVYG